MNRAERQCEGTMHREDVGGGGASAVSSCKGSREESVHCTDRSLILGHRPRGRYGTITVKWDCPGRSDINLFIYILPLNVTSSLMAISPSCAYNRYNNALPNSIYNHPIPACLFIIKRKKSGKKLNHLEVSWHFYLNRK